MARCHQQLSGLQWKHSSSSKQQQVGAMPLTMAARLGLVERGALSRAAAVIREHWVQVGCAGRVLGGQGGQGRVHGWQGGQGRFHGGQSGQGRVHGGQGRFHGGQGSWRAGRQGRFHGGQGGRVGFMAGRVHGGQGGQVSWRAGRAGFMAGVVSTLVLPAVA